jgi:HD-GYP domain-containing protein (c-di-GMP phosphodiesterase class II)
VGTSDAAEDSGEALDLSDSRAQARENFWRAVHGTRGLLARAAGTGRPALGKARRLVQPVVDHIARDDYSIIGLTALKNHDEYTYAHCVNVSVLSVAIGAVLGLPRPALARLGVSALLHDLGKLAVPAEVLHKPGKLDAKEWEQIEHHPLDGVRMLSRTPGFTHQIVDAMIVSFQHHMNLDGSGYPARGSGAGIAPISRIVAVADVFDALTAHRAYRHRPYTGREALGILLGHERARYEPAALWALVQAVGLYPPGTVMRTRSGHVVVSVSPNRRDVRRPVCRVLAKPGSRAVDRRGTEWWEPMPDSDSVLGVVSPDEHRLDLSGLLAA